MSEVTKNKYTLETLLPLNVSYDRDHILRQQDVDMVNRLPCMGTDFNGSRVVRKEQKPEIFP